MTVLAGEGLVKGFWGKGYFSSGSGNEKHENLIPARIPKHQLIYKKLSADILNGTFRPNEPLPGINQLGALYGVSRPTICKVLEGLLSEKIIRRIGVRHYLYNTTNTKRLKIAIVAFGLSRNEIKITSERERNFYRNISSTAIQQNVDLQILCYNDYLDTPRFHIPDGQDFYTYIQQADICGFILSTYHMNNSARCLRKIISTGKPVSICVEDQQVLESMTRYSRNSRGITFFDASYSTIPGKDVGIYLREKGHREIAYISPFHKSTWSRNRLAGLTEIYDARKSHRRVHPFVLDEYVRDYSFMEKVLEKPTFATDVAVDKIVSRIPPFMKNRISSIKMEYDLLLRDALLFTYCEPLIRKASSQPLITAWVCANDLIACMIMDYWKCHDVAADNRPALIGFDNSFDAFERGISTYEFDTGGETRSMLTHLLYPNSSLLSKSRRIIRLNGSVIERASSFREP